MTNAVTSTNGSRNGSKQRPKRSGKQSAIGEQTHKRTGIDLAIGLLTPIVGQEFLDKYGLRDPLNRTLRYGTRQIFSAAGAASRQSIGTTVFGGMLAATLLTLLFVPVFYAVIEGLRERGHAHKADHDHASIAQHAPAE